MDNLINLIESVRNHPKLFKNTVNNDDQDDLNEWSAVAEECKMTIADVQEQWNHLLIEYVDYLRNNRDFPLAKHMDFLQPYFFTIIDHENIDENELLNAIDSKKIDEIHVSDLKEMKNDQNIKIEHMAELEGASTVKSPETQSVDTDISTSLTTLHNSSPFTNMSSLELIFLGYAKQLQRMPLPLQLKTKRKIANIMDEAELQMMS